MRLFHFCSLGMLHRLLRAALRDLLWKQLNLFTAKVIAHALISAHSQLKAQQVRQSLARPRTHLGSIRFSQGLLVGNQHGMMRTPPLLWCCTI